MTYKYIPSTLGISMSGLVYQKGGSYETAEQQNRGISHLMEHLMCKTFDDLRPAMRRNGINYNAFTSDNRVVFYWEGLDPELGQFIPELHARILDRDKRKLWTKEAFEMEKLTVLEEYADAFNEQTSGFFRNLLRRHYGLCGAIGFKSDIENFTYEQSIAEADTFLRPDLIVEVGETNYPDLPNDDSFKFEDQDVLRFTEASGILEEAIPKQGKTIVGLIGKTPIPKDRSSEVGFLLGCLTKGLESPLYQEIREKRGLSYFSLAFACLVGSSFVPFFAASTSNDRAEELAGVYQDFFLSDISKHLTKERFDICYAELMIRERRDKILAHEGAARTVLADTNPYDVLRNISYERLIEIGNEVFSGKTLLEVQH